MNYTCKINKNLSIFSFCILALSILFFNAGCKKTETGNKEAKAKLVEVTNIKKGTMPVKVGFTGNLFSNNEVSIVPREAGQVSEIFVDEGDYVKEGQILLKINDDKLLAEKNATEAELAVLKNQYEEAVLNFDLMDSTVSVGINQADQSLLQAQANADQIKLQMDQAKIDLDRQENLYQKGAVSKQSLENAQLTYDTSVKQYETALSIVENAKESLVMAQANSLQKDIRGQAIEAVQGQINSLNASLKLINIRLNDCEIKAPFDGVITFRDKTISKSSIVASNASSPIFRMVDNNNLYMEGVVSEGKIAAMKPGCKVDILLDSFPNQTFTGKLVTIVPSIDSSTMSFTVRASVDNKDGKLAKGMFGRAEIEIENAEGLIIPFASIIKAPTILGTPETAVEGPHTPLNELDSSSIYSLFIYKDGKAIKKNVIVKVVTQDHALVTGGVTKEDEINDKDQIITTSIKTLQNNELVKIVNQETKQTARQDGSDNKS